MFYVIFYICTPCTISIINNKLHSETLKCEDEEINVVKVKVKVNVDLYSASS